MQKWHRELMHRLRAEGISVPEIKQGGKSMRMLCQRNGQEYLYHVAISASDHRAMDNAVKEIVRGLRQKEDHAANA